MTRTEASELREFLDAVKANLADVQARELKVFNLHQPTLGRDFYSKRLRLVCETCQPKGDDLERINPAVPWPCATARSILDPVCFQSSDAIPATDDTEESS